MLRVVCEGGGPESEVQKVERIDQWKYRHAIQLAAQLPEDTADAIKILEITILLVRRFLVEGLS